jgi:hypothetical protein
LKTFHTLLLAALFGVAAFSSYAAPPVPPKPSVKAAQGQQPVPQQAPQPPKLELRNLGGYLVAANSDPILALMIADRALKSKAVDEVWNERLKDLKEPIKDLEGKVIYPVPKGTAYPPSVEELQAEVARLTAWAENVQRYGAIALFLGPFLWMLFRVIQHLQQKQRRRESRTGMNDSSPSLP